MPNRQGYPFAAVVGQAQFKLALILAMINPRLDGVLISGPRGVAKSTLCRAISDLSPEPMPFVTLPLGCSDDMLLGSLNLQKVLNEQQVSVQAGLLSKANGGILYVDEVNLLADHQVDLLLDVAQSGVHHLERDGISQQQAADFVLLGSMNPDEGELRPQLQDRFGLCIELDNAIRLEDRVEIVRRREAFAANPDEFVQRFAAETQQLRHRIASAQAMLPHVSIDDTLRFRIAEWCAAAHVDGVRADIVWLHAAQAHAAWQQRATVIAADLDAVAELVLVHRRQAPPTPANNATKPPFQRPNPPSDNTGHNAPRSKGTAQSSANHTPDDSGSASGKEPNGNQGDWGQMPMQSQAAQRLPEAQLPEPFSRATKSPANGKFSASSLFANQQQGRKGLGIGRISSRNSNKPNWLQSIKANFGRPLSHLAQLHWLPNRYGQPVINLILLDCSASVLQQNGFAKAKGCMLAFAQWVYLQRQQLVIQGFGNDQVDLLLPKRRAPKTIKHWLDQLQAGGGTPIRQAISQAHQLQQTWQQQQPDVLLRTLILTDGKTTQSLNNLHLLGEVTVIDCEQQTIKRGKCAELAQQLQARLLPLPHALV